LFPLSEGCCSRTPGYDSYIGSAGTSLAMQVNCTARNASILRYESFLFSCLWEWIHSWSWI